MQEEKNSSGASRREALYIKVLIISTAVMLLFVFIVFLSAGGAVQGDTGVVSDTGTTVVDTTSADETSINNNDTSDTDETTDSDIQVTGPDKDYIPITNSLTKVMSDASLDAEYAILVDLQSNTVISSFHADQQIYPASMTKLMTLIIAVENIDDLDATFTITEDILDPLYAAGASRTGFEAGEIVTMLDLLYGAALPSGADATDALAIYVAGSEEEFVKLMNEKAAALGLTATHFMNASGLHNKNHYSTVREIAAIMAYAMDNELISQLLSAKSYTTSSTQQHPSGITLYSTAFSRMSTYTFGKVTVEAAKTGYTEEAKFCLASFGTTEDGHKYVLVTAYGTDKYAPVYDCKYAFSTFIK